jgi:hypothetical protein
MQGEQAFSFSSGRRRLCMLVAAAAAAATIFLPGPALAQVVDNPPLLPRAITVFPERDFISAEGFVPNADLLVQVLRNGVLSDATGTSNASGLLEVNHPGGICWNKFTPDIGPADVVQVTYMDTGKNRALVPSPVAGAGSAVITQNVTATQAYDAGDGTVIVKGKAQLADGSPIPLDRLEVRIINKDFIDPPTSRITRRDIRADISGGRILGVPGGGGTLAYDSPTATTFTAVLFGMNAAERLLAVQGQTRVMGWQVTTAGGDRLGVTIYEVGEVGGPGIGGCPAGPGGPILASAPTPPVYYNPASLTDADRVQPGLVTVFPDRDFVSIEGYPAGSDLQVVVRRGPVGAQSVVGTARGIVPRLSTGLGGPFEVNHPGGVCWTGQTPDIQAGDWIDVFRVIAMAPSYGQTQQVIDTRVTKSASISSNQVRVYGRSIHPKTGKALPLTLMEQRIVNPDFTDPTISRVGRRDIRADATGSPLGSSGSLIPNSSGTLISTTSGGGTQWQATYIGLNATEQQLAVAGQNRALAWLFASANGDRFGVTISEFGEVGGPGFGGCPATGSASIPLPTR